MNVTYYTHDRGYVTDDPTNRDYISPQEEAALKELKTHDIAKNFTDRFLLSFLFSRKLKIDRTLKLLENNLKWRKANGYEKPIEFSEVNKALLLDSYSFMIPGKRTKSGHALAYILMGKYNPKAYTIEDQYKVFMWSWEWTVLNEGIDVQRNGLAFVEDLSNVSLKNVDFANAKKITAAFQDNFPQRFGGIFIVNAGTIIKALLAFAKLIMKKKIVDRVKIMKTYADLLQHIDAEQLLDQFGGQISFDLREWVNQLDKAYKERTSSSAEQSIDEPEVKLVE